MIKRIMAITFPLTLLGLFFYVGGPSSFKLTGEPPNIEVRGPNGFDQIIPPSQAAFIYEWRDDSNQIQCNIAAQEQIVFNLTSKIMPNFIHDHQEHVMEQLRVDTPTEITNISQEKIADTPALYYSYILPKNGPNTIEGRVIAAYMIAGGYAINITCSAPLDTSGKIAIAFQEIVNSIEFNPI